MSATASAEANQTHEVIKIGYETDFEGVLKVNKPLTPELMAYLEQIYNEDHKVLEGMPSDWCNWTVEDETTIMAESGKAYETEKWLKYIIEHILKPKGYILNGQIEWYGEDPTDMGRYVVKNNEINIQNAKITYEDSD